MDKSTEVCGSIFISGGFPIYCSKPKGHDYGHSWEGPTREEIRNIIREEIEANVNRLRPFGIGTL